MRPAPSVRYPQAQQEAYRKARRLEYLTIGYILSSIAFLYLVMGASQAMRTSWMEDMISLVPPTAFLICSVVARARPTRRFPYGKHGVVSIGYVASALALTAMGGFLFYEAAAKLIAAERTTIGGFSIFGVVVWAGWPMLAALLYTAVPSFFLGRAKLKLAPQLHDKILYADAEMNRADWMSELAAAAGVIGTGFGFWWADAAFAGIVSLDILRDGFRNLRIAVSDLIDEAPRTTEGEGDTVPDRVSGYLASLDWIEQAEVRMREQGHVFYGEAFIVPRDDCELSARTAELAQDVRALDWRIQEIVIMPVTELRPIEASSSANID